MSKVIDGGIDSDHESRVDVWMKRFSAAPLETPPPNPALIWWKAQAARQREDERRATLPIRIAEIIQVGLVTTGGVSLAAFTGSTRPVAAMLSTAVLVSAAASAAWANLARTPSNL
jgi:hypothetical protein